MLGRERPTVELCRLSVLPGAALLVVPDMLVLLAERARELACCALSPWTLEPEAAVCVVRPGGSLTGLVGDLTFGLTNPVAAGDAWSGGGFFTEEGAEAFAAGVVVLGVIVFSVWDTFLSGVCLGAAKFG